MEKTIRSLKLIYFLPIAFSLLMVVCFESDLIAEGVWCCVGERTAEFVVTTVMELLSICVIPIALGLFRWPRIKAALPGAPHALLRYGALRLALIMLPLMLNTLFYYLFISVPFGYMAIILFIASIFIFPSASRCHNETAAPNTTEE